MSIIEGLSDSAPPRPTALEEEICRRPERFES
jgi:hypothetical protein